MVALALDQLAAKCNTKDGCESSRDGSKCAETQYKDCRAQKTYYFNDCSPGMLICCWKGLKEYMERRQSMSASGTLSNYGIEKEQLRLLMIDTIMRALTVYWGTNDRN